MMFLEDNIIQKPTKARRFWLSDYIQQKRKNETRSGSESRLGMARRMPRANRSHEKLFDDTLKMLSKTGQTQPIIINFEKKINATSRQFYCNTARNKSSFSPRILIDQKPKTRYQKISINLMQRIKTQTDRSSVCFTPKPTSRSIKLKQRTAFEIKASDQWLYAQKQILKINLKQQLSRLQKRRIKKIRLGRDNRTIQQLISELKN